MLHLQTPAKGILTQNTNILVLESDVCPVKLFDYYMSKLNIRSDLWQRPKQKVQEMDSCWYDDQVVGRDPLNELMKTISKDAELSMIYTNHSIRATTITKLEEHGFEARHIQAVSGHKSENTIKCYSKKCPDKKKRQMSNALSSELPQKVPKIATATISKRPVTNDNSNFPDIDFLDFVPIENNADDFDLSNIIDTLDKETKQSKQIVPSGINVPSVPAKSAESAQTSNYIHNVTTNQMQTHPMLP